MELGEVSETKPATPFTEAGDCSDEVVFEFDDGKKLYVSQNFLYYVSPVFKAMFQQHFKEKESRKVELKGKSFEDVLEFLLCLHPDVQKTIDYANVFTVVYLAEEYQAQLLIKKCKSVMTEWLESELQNAQSSSSIKERVKNAKTCLLILTEAETFQYIEIIEHACSVLGKFGHSIFSGTVSDNKVYPRIRGLIVKPNNEDLVQDCKTLFDKLPLELRYRLMLERIRLCDNLDMQT